MLPSPADGDVAAVLDATTGLVQASAEDRTTRAWQVDRPLDASGLEGPASLAADRAAGRSRVSAIVVVAVLCLPTSNRRRSER